MNPRRLATLAALCQTVVLPTGVAAWLAVAALGSAGNGNSGSAAMLDRVGPSLAANATFADEPRRDVIDDKPPAITVDDADVAAVETVTVPTTNITDSPVASREPEPVVTAALTDPAETLPPAAPASQAAALSTPDPEPRDAGQTVSSVAVLDECFVADACIDRYLWTLYQRTPKEDSIKESERKKVTIKRKGKLVTVTRTFTKLVDEDFAWKDPKAAEKSGMPMIDYVIGGMDRNFKLKLFQTLRAAEDAGLSPGITSAFRDDYRQSIASGLKAANNRSYHGGSIRGGYGHGLAADIVSVNGATRAQRWTSTEILWKWVDAHGKEFGIARPYLDRDPPHVAPIDGQEYADHSRGTKAQQSRAQQSKVQQAKTQSKAQRSKTQQSLANSRKPNKLAADRGTTKRQSNARSKVKST
jgi:hypothetical protein